MKTRKWGSTMPLQPFIVHLQRVWIDTHFPFVVGINFAACANMSHLLRINGSTFGFTGDILSDIVCFKIVFIQCL